MKIELVCPYCHFSKKVPEEKIPDGARLAICPNCRRRFEFSITKEGIGFSSKEYRVEEGCQAREEPWTREEEKSGKPSEEPLPSGVPWENRSEIGLWQAIYQTFRMVLFSPETLFSSMKNKTGIWEPLAFGLLFGSAGAMFGFFWQFLFLSGDIINFVQSFFGQFTVCFIFLIMLIIVPFIIIISMFIVSGILHLLLLIVGGGTNGFETTFKVVAYTQAAQIWGLIPVFGSFVGGIWQLIIQIIGLKEAHKTSYLRVIIALLIPVAIMILVVAALILFAIYFSQQ